MTDELDPRQAIRQFILKIPIDMELDSNAQEVVDKVADSLSFLQSLDYLRGLQFRQATLTECT